MTAKLDVAVAGGGLTGLALAAALGSAGARVAVIEAQQHRTLQAPGYDGRVTAIARGSMNFLRTIGVWDKMGDKAGPIYSIIVGESASPVRVQFDSQ
ncbi:MAG: FAD-dependent monooxygenase, partial [Pseudomonadota bacterium]